VIEFFPDIETAKHLTGIESERELAAFFQKAGIPYKTYVSGGRISNIRIGHIFVETFVPYSNYRGAVIDEQGKTWIALDTSIKVLGYTENIPAALPDGISIPEIRDAYLAAVQTLTPLEYLRQVITQGDPDTAYQDFLRTRTLIPETLKILPASLQFKEIAITHEYTRIPDDLMHSVRFLASQTPSESFFDITLPAHGLSNRSVALTYEPETVEDQEIINSYGGLSNTPAYLVHLRPVLTVEGERLAVGTGGLPMGEDYTLSMKLISPNGTVHIENTHITGNLSVMGIVSQNAIEPEEIAFEEKNAERLLYEEAVQYIKRWNQAETELGSLLGLSLTRPIPTLVTLGGVIDVTYLLDTLHGFEWKGVYVDADLRALEAGVCDYSDDPAVTRRSFMQLSAVLRKNSYLLKRLTIQNFFDLIPNHYGNDLHISSIHIFDVQ